MIKTCLIVVTSFIFTGSLAAEVSLTKDQRLELYRMFSGKVENFRPEKIRDQVAKDEDNKEKIRERLMKMTHEERVAFIEKLRKERKKLKK